MSETRSYAVVDCCRKCAGYSKAYPVCYDSKCACHDPSPPVNPEPPCEFPLKSDQAYCATHDTWHRPEPRTSEPSEGPVARLARLLSEGGAELVVSLTPAQWAELLEIKVRAAKVEALSEVSAVPCYGCAKQAAIERALQALQEGGR